MKTANALKSYFETPNQCTEQIRKGDKEAFEKLFKTYSKELHWFLTGLVKRDDIAEELLQDVFVKIWEQRHSLDPTKNIKSYLYKIARNIAIDLIRHQNIELEWEKEKKGLHEFSSVTISLDERLHNKMILDDVKKAIQELPQRRRLIFVLSRYNQMTYKEIARVLEISTNTVETQMSRALNSLREKFSPLL